MNSNFLPLTCPSCKNTLTINAEYPGSHHKCDNCNKYHALIRENGIIIGITSGIRSVESHTVEKHENMQCLQQHLERYVPLADWEFTQSTEFFVHNSPQSLDYRLDENGYPAIIYKSQKCKVFFMLDYSGSGRSYAAFIYYGRLHAPDNKSTLEWNNSECYCWHSVDFMLPFLDGVSPRIATTQRQKVSKELAGNSKFLNSGTVDIQSPLHFHTAIWNKYGNSFFDLFDLNNNNLWLSYRQYRKECYDFHGWNANHIPDIHNIC